MKVLVDTGLWRGLLDPRNQNQEEAFAFFELVEENESRLLIPWPTMYELIRTTFFKNKTIAEFERFKIVLFQQRIDFIEDDEYRNAALEKTLATENFGGRRLSFVDNIIREMVLDENLSFEALATFNNKDFADVCAIRNIEIFP